MVGPVVFCFQGVQGNSPILAGVKLAPLALGMLIASPLAGVWADRRGSRTLAVMGMLVTALGLGLMTTIVGAGISAARPKHAGAAGVVPPATDAPEVVVR